MLLPRPRVWMLMASVAVAAIPCWAIHLHRRSCALSSIADYHLAAAHQLEFDSRSSLCGYGIPRERLERMARERALRQDVMTTAAEFHRRLERKYRSAAARPWLPVDRDPAVPPEGNPKILTADDY